MLRRRKRVYGVATLASAEEGDIAFLANPKYRKQLPPQGPGRSSSALASPADHRRAAFRRQPLCVLRPGLPTCSIPSLRPVGRSDGDRRSHVPAACQHRSPSAVIGRDVPIRIGMALSFTAVCVIGDGVAIGDGACFYARATVYPDAG